MHTYEVTYTNSEIETVYCERIQFTPTHIVFDNTQAALGYGRFELVKAIIADQVESVREVPHRMEE